MIIRVEALSKKLKGRMVLDGISLEMNSGKVYGFRGTNGSGKTMLMRAIAGLIIPTSGRVIIDDRIICKDIDFAQNMGLMIENPAFVNNYTGYENLKLIADIKKLVGDAEIRSCLERVGLDPDDKRTFKKYSLGMKQKLGIACAILENPKLLILDEPFNALDEAGCQVVRDIIADYKKKGGLVIVSCHDRAQLDNLADVIFELYEGKLMGEKID